MSRTARTFSDHLRELRLRLFVSFLFFVAGGVLTYCLNVPILQAIQQSLRQTLYYTTPAGAFNLAMKISFIGGVVFVLPAIIYNAASFVQPALTRRFTKAELRLMTMLTLALAAAGAAFAYYLVVPMSLNFFQKFDVKGFQSLISATEYVNFVVNCVLIFVIMFQLPLLLLFIDRVKPLPPKKLWGFEKFVVVGSLVIALVLPFTYDPLTQFLIALPIIVLYNISICLIMLSHRAQKRHLNPEPPHAQVIVPVVRPEAVVAHAVALPQAAAMSVAPRVVSTAKSPRSVDGFAPRQGIAVHTGKAAPSTATHRNAPQRASGRPSQHLISDFITQPVKRSAQYERRIVSDAPRPRRIELPHFGVDASSDVLPQQYSEG